MDLNEREENNKKKSSNVYKELGPYLNLGWQLVITMVLGVLLGNWLDSKNNTSPLWLGVFSGLGIVIGLYNFIKTALQSNKKKKHD